MFSLTLSFSLVYVLPPPVPHCVYWSVARCVQYNESVLLVGETGVGKTACISYLSSLTGNKLLTINLSQQTDSSDLLGG